MIAGEIAVNLDIRGDTMGDSYRGGCGRAVPLQRVVSYALLSLYVNSIAYDIIPFPKRFFCDKFQAEILEIWVHSLVLCGWTIIFLVVYRSMCS